MAAAAATAWIVGCGDVGCRLALRLQRDGVAVTGFARNIAPLQRLGIRARALDLDTPPAVESLAEPTVAADWLFYLAPPPPDGERDLRLRALLGRLAAAPRRLIYLSTSGVYGDCAGAWIDERAPLAPAHVRAARRVDAERAVAEYARRHHGAALVVRAPGIYGPGRLPVDRLARGTPLPVAAQAPWSNRIHVDDLVEALLCVARHGAAGGCYNASDGAPTTTTDYLLACAERLGLAAPVQRPLAEVLASAKPMQREFLSESKRLRNDALRALGWRPRYADFKTGLAHCADDDPVTSARRWSA